MSEETEAIVVIIILFSPVIWIIGYVIYKLFRQK